MTIRYVHGNILEAPENYIIHGCNAQGRMGSGLAKVLFERYPKVRTEYLRQHAIYQKNNTPFLGTVHYVVTDHELHVIINAITQEDCGNDGKLYASYDAIRVAFKNVNFHAQLLSGEPDAPSMKALAIPLIGCGLAGGDWKIVSQIIEEEAKDFEPVVYLIDGKIPD